MGSGVGKVWLVTMTVGEPTLKSHCTREPKGTIAAISKLHDLLLNSCADGFFVRRVSQDHLQLLNSW